MEKEQIWEYIMAIRNNVLMTIEPPENGKKEAMLEQRRIVIAFEKKLLQEIEQDSDFESFIKNAIDCALGEYPYEDLLMLYKQITAN